MKKVLILGTTCLDQVALVERLPQSDEEFEPLEQFERIGGEGYRMVNVFHYFNMPYTLISPVGEGVYAESVLKAFKELGLKDPFRVNDLNGCTYTMIDKKGNSRKMAVQGAELDFESYPFEEINVDEYACLLCNYETLLYTFGAVYELLLQFKEHLYLYVDTPDFFADEELLQAICALKPVLIFTDAHAFNSQENMQEWFNTLQKMTQMPVHYVSSEGICRVYYEDEEFSFGHHLKSMKDNSGLGELYLAAYALARNSGVRMMQACLFASELAKDYLQTYEVLLNEENAQTYKEQLASAIMHIEGEMDV